MTSRADSLTHEDLQKAEIERLRAALAEARGLLEAFYRADIDPHKYDRTAKWLERNP